MFVFFNHSRFVVMVNMKEWLNCVAGINCAEESLFCRMWQKAPFTSSARWSGSYSSLLALASHGREEI